MDVDFLNDVMNGLSQQPKKLFSKYFYNAEGDRLFQEIMALPEYYLSDCEKEIILTQKNAIIEKLPEVKKFDVIELGPGDGSKSIHLLRTLAEKQGNLLYLPIDISQDVISFLEGHLLANAPRIEVQGLQGDYFEKLRNLGVERSNPKFLLFLGSSIGNMYKEESFQFLEKIKDHLNDGDVLFIGFDLKKDGGLILDAYNDAAGITKAFNLNLLARINNELAGDFVLGNFEHCPEYHPETGACESYLVSNQEQSVTIQGQTFHFEKNERIFMEVSQKFEVKELRDFAKKNSFTELGYFYDSNKWYVNALWKVNKG